MNTLLHENLKRMEQAVTEWMIQTGLLGDAKFYSRDAWKEREKDSLNDACCVLMIDGSPLSTLLNHGGDHQAFDALIASFGFFYELGNAWNLGFYPREGEDFPPSTGS